MERCLGWLFFILVAACGPGDPSTAEGAAGQLGDDEGPASGDALGDDGAPSGDSDGAEHGNGDDSSGGDPGGGDSGAALPWVQAPVHAPAGALCAIPADYLDLGGDPVHIPCAMEADRFSDRAADDFDGSLRVVTWNLHFGSDHAALRGSLLTHAALAEADVLLLNEVARLDQESKPPLLNQARDLAQALAMDYVFAVEWDRRAVPDQGGEHGIAILSKYPLGNVQLIRHTPVNEWLAHDGRLGGRATLVADARVGARLVRLYSSHLDNRPLFPPDAEAGRAAQGAEILTHASIVDAPSMQVVGGDLNTWVCVPLLADCTRAPGAEQVVEDFLAAGWLDGTAGKNFGTYTLQVSRLDWIFYRGVSAIAGDVAADAAGSDHLPVYFDLAP